MQLENVVVDAADPRALGRFWEAALGTERLTDEADIFETRLSVEDGPWLDLCFQQVAERPGPGPRLHLDLDGGDDPEALVARLVGLGATRLDTAPAGADWVVLADPEGHELCVVGPRPAYAGTGAVAALPLHSADPARDAAFWAWLTGWSEVDAVAPRSLRHPSGRGPLLELVDEARPKGPAKNAVHFDLRLGADEDPDEVEAAITARSGRREPHPEWGELPWRTYRDPSGNEFCVLAASVS
jgi:hypothetical protein